MKYRDVEKRIAELDQQYVFLKEEANGCLAVIDQISDPVRKREFRERTLAYIAKEVKKFEQEVNSEYQRLLSRAKRTNPFDLRASKQAVILVKTSIEQTKEVIANLKNVIAPALQDKLAEHETA